MAKLAFLTMRHIRGKNSWVFGLFSEILNLVLQIFSYIWALNLNYYCYYFILLVVVVVVVGAVVIVVVLVVLVVVVVLLILLMLLYCTF